MAAGDQIIFGDGYTPEGINGTTGGGGGGAFTGSQTYVRPAQGRVWHPPIEAVAAVPEIPPTPTVVKRIKREGWNTSARSIAKLTKGSYFLFNVMTGVSGSFLGIGPAGMDGQGISAFSHAIICDRNGVHVHEKNVLVYLLKNSQYATSLLRIYRHTDGAIVMVSTTASETLVYTSSVKYPALQDSYIYGVLYSSGDEVLSASFNTGEVLYASV